MENAVKKITIIVFVLLLSSCATFTRYLGFYSVAPYIGEKESQFRATCPFIYHVNETRTQYGIHRQYVMENSMTHPQYVYFENGILTAMQD